MGASGPESTDKIDRQKESAALPCGRAAPQLSGVAFGEPFSTGFWRGCRIGLLARPPDSPSGSFGPRLPVLPGRAGASATSFPPSPPQTLPSRRSVSGFFLPRFRLAASPRSARGRPRDGLRALHSVTMYNPRSRGRQGPCFGASRVVRSSMRINHLRLVARGVRGGLRRRHGEHPSTVRSPSFRR